MSRCRPSVAFDKYSTEIPRHPRGPKRKKWIKYGPDADEVDEAPKKLHVKTDNDR